MTQMMQNADMLGTATAVTATSLAFKAEGPEGGYQILPQLDDNLASYTLVYDIRVPDDQPGDFGGLFQTDGINASDADLFLTRTGPGVLGIGISGQYEGEVRAGEWARVAFAVTGLGDGSSRIDKYVDGALVGTQTGQTGRFTISAEKGFMILADESNETFSGELASFSLLDRALDASEVAALGGHAPGGAFGSAPAGARLFEFDFAGGSQIERGTGQATVGEAEIVARSFEAVGVTDALNHLLLTSGETIEIDVADHFFGENLTFSFANSDNTAVDARLVNGKLVVDAKTLGFTDLRVTATDDLGNSFTDLFRVRVAGENAYTVAVLPDTQNYTEEHTHIFGDMTRFLADNKDTMNVQFVAHVGDITGSNLPDQWQIASDAYEALEAVGIKYSLLPGNHDQAAGGTANDHSSNLDAFFGMDRYFADSAGEAHGVYDGEPDSARNNYKTFTAPDGTRWISLNMEFGPRDDVLRWADEVLTEFSDHRAMVSTHHYTNFGDIAGPQSGPLYTEGTGKNYGMGGDPQGVNDGRDIWDSLISKHGNVSFVFSGHVFGDGAETIVRYGEQGNKVFQMLVNYQNGVSPIIQTAGNPDEDGRGGNGAMRLLVIDPDNDSVHTETYYAELDTFMTASRGDPVPSRNGSGTIAVPDREIQPVDFGTTEGLGAPPIPGDDGSARAIRLPQFDPDNGLKVVPGFDPAGGGATYQNYTLVWDMFIPSGIGLSSILQTDLENLSDGDLWIQGGAEGLIGGDGQDDGPFALDAWSRVAVVFERVPGEDPAWRADKYVNGVLMGSQVFEGDRRIINKDGFLLFGDDSLEVPDGWLLSSFAMVETAMTSAEVAGLGGVDADGPFTALPAGVNGVQFDFSNGDFTPTLGTGSMGQEIGGSTEVALTGRFLEHQESFDGVDLGEVATQFRADAGEDVVVNLDETDSVTLDGSGVVDKLGQIVSAVWTDSNGIVVADTLTASIAAAPGYQRYTLTVADAEGVTSSDSMMAVAIDQDTLLFEDFNDGDLDGWTAAAGDWQATGAANSAGGVAQAYLRNISDEPGLILYDGAGAAGWRNYTVRATIENEGTAAMGLVANARGDSMYRLEFDTAAHEIRLARIIDGEREVLATETRSAPFDMRFDAELSVSRGQMTAAVDGDLLFGGTVFDDHPLRRGTVGVFHEGTTPRAVIDDIEVRRGGFIADAGDARRVIDFDGDGTVEVDLTAASGRGKSRWYEDGELLAKGARATVDLEVGSHLVELVQTRAGATDRDTALIEIVAAYDLLLAEDFGSGSDGWRFVDEGELGDPAAWSVVDGALTQAADRYSRQLMGSGDTAPNSYWGLNWSPLGDGHHVLRKGTYALWDDPAAADWSDYSVEFDFSAPSGGAVGLVFAYADAQNHMKLELDREGGTSQLVSVAEGIEEIAWQAPVSHHPDETNRLRLDFEDGTISAWVNGTALFDSIRTDTPDAGTFGLYNWGAPGTSYDDLVVVSLADDARAADIWAI